MFKQTCATLKDKSGSALIEFSLLMFLLFTVTFSIVEGGYIFYQFNSAQKATQIGARIAATRAPVVTGLADCGVALAPGDGILAGTNCRDVSGYDFAPIVCNDNDSANGCNDDAWERVFAAMQNVYPNIEKSNLEITTSPTGLGFVGRGKPVPAITVTLKNLSYNYIAVGALLKTDSFDLGTALNFDTTQTTIIAEDIGEGA